MSLNVCGLTARQVYPEFRDFISQYDIVCFQETKLDDIDINKIDLYDFDILFKNRKIISKRRSGGISVAIKTKYFKYVRELKTESKLALWFVLSHTLTGLQSDTLCGAVYIPPQGSEFAVRDPYSELQSELNNLSSKHNYGGIMIIGDTNSRTGMQPETIHVDEFLSHEHNLETILDEYNQEMLFFNNSSVSINRENRDKTTNNFGYDLIEFCKCNNVFILNGRSGNDKGKGLKTCRDASTVDYFICSPTIFSLVANFDVLEFCKMLSDVHNPISLEMNVNNVPVIQSTVIDRCDTILLWNPEKSDIFFGNIDSQKLHQINEKLATLDTHIASKDTINDITDDIENVFTTCAKNSFGFKSNRANTGKYKSTDSWFGNDCRTARRNFHSAKYHYKLRQTDINKLKLNDESKKYKSTLNNYYKKFKQDKVNKLRKLRKGHPKEYWKIINENKQPENIKCPLDKLVTHFTNINQVEEENNNNPQTPETETNDSINGPITQNEIEKVIKTLKNNKACGLDSIVNEHIKSTASILMPTYIIFFNIILDTGIVPESWTVGVIKPIYKKNGEVTDPSNYRPITLLSCFGKLFTAIINNRLTSYAEENNIISDCQTGFRKGFSTADNVFVLFSLIQHLFTRKKKLFCAFIDFKSAFDKVWRAGLWSKLNDCRINGKCLTLIKNMYQNVKSCITANGKKSNFFTCNVGVRQGENLSPLLFSLFINDLEHYLGNNDISGIDCNTHGQDDELMIYVKMFLLMYADDTALMSETDEDLQDALNIFESYCQQWKLTVNTKKSKVVIFSKGRISSKYKFLLNNTPLEIVKEYKYLGIFLPRSGSFYKTKKHLASQATRAMYSLLSKIRKQSLPIDIQIDLFEKTIKPILLYGSEIWGFGNNDILERVQLKFYKHVLSLKRSTPSIMVYGELGIYPLQIDIQTRSISFWTKLIAPESRKLSALMYSITLSHYNHSEFEYSWIKNIKTILQHCGFPGIWDSQDPLNPKWLVCTIKQKLIDIYISEWRASVYNDNTYRLYKDSIMFEDYLKLLNENEYKYIIAFRTRNHKLPIETGRWRNIARESRKCHLCKSELGDEYHYLLCCKKLKHVRETYIKPYYYKRPNVIKFHQLLSTHNVVELKKLSKFIQRIMKSCPR